MRRSLPFLSLLIWIAFSSCYRQAYFLSPYNATTNYYHSIPSMSDSTKSATYFSGAFSAGGANDFYEDEVYSFHSYIHRSHSFKNLQAYYGVNASIGTYNVDKNSFYNNYTSTPIYYRTGHKFFGGAGVSGGLNLVVPLGSRHEWRVIGLQTTFQKEYGDYFDFRKTLPDSSANAIDRHSVFISAGLTTEFVFKLRNKAKLGYKLAIGSSLQNTGQYFPLNDMGYESIIPVYVSNTFHFGRNNLMGFAQINLGSYAANFQMGFNYRLGAKLK